MPGCEASVRILKYPQEAIVASSGITNVFSVVTYAAQSILPHAVNK